MAKGETRVFPSCCRSAFCGRLECGGCRHKPVLDEFNAWREETAAVVADRIWSPTVFRATK